MESCDWDGDPPSFGGGSVAAFVDVEGGAGEDEDEDDVSAGSFSSEGSEGGRREPQVEDAINWRISEQRLLTKTAKSRALHDAIRDSKRSEVQARCACTCANATKSGIGNRESTNNRIKERHKRNERRAGKSGEKAEKVRREIGESNSLIIVCPKMFHPFTAKDVEVHNLSSKAAYHVYAGHKGVMGGVPLVFARMIPLVP